MPNDEIAAICERLVDALKPVAVYLFGSYAYGTPNEDSDLDIYVVMPDDCKDLPTLSGDAYRAVRSVKRRPVDIVLGTKRRFVERASLPSIERDIAEQGVLLYG